MAKAKINPEFTYKTRNGQEVTSVKFVDAKEGDPYTVSAFINGCEEFFTERGYYYYNDHTHCNDRTHCNDLIKQPVKKTKPSMEVEVSPLNIQAVPHKHHDLIVDWAKDTSKKVQCRGGDGDAWITVTPDWNEGLQYRFKPEEPKFLTIIGADGKSRSYPEPCSDALEQDVKYFIASAVEDEFQFSATWGNDRSDNKWLDRGLVHFTKEAAELHAKAMLGID